MIQVYVVAVAVLVAGAAGAGAGYHLRDLSATKSMAVVQKQHAEALAKARDNALARERAARDEERALAASLMETVNATQDALAAARRDIVARDAAADRLRNEFATRVANLASSVRETSPAPDSRAPAAGAGLVLTDVFGRTDARLRSCAAALDESRAAGQACERAYDAAVKATESGAQAP